MQLAYAIGMVEPISFTLDLHGTGKADEKKVASAVKEIFPMTPKGIIDALDLLRPIYRSTAVYGHFGRELPDFTWEKCDKGNDLANL